MALNAPVYIYEFISSPGKTKTPDSGKAGDDGGHKEVLQVLQAGQAQALWARLQAEVLGALPKSSVVVQ